MTDVPVYDRAECERLAREAREDDERMSVGRWSVDEWGALGHIRVDGVSVGISSMGSRIDAAAIARTRNNLRAVAAQLDAATMKIDRLIILLDLTVALWKGRNSQYHAERRINVELGQERDRLLDEIETARAILGASPEESLKEAAERVEVAIAEGARERDAIAARRDELLHTIARLSQELPFPDESKDWQTQRAQLLAEVGSLRSQVAEHLRTIETGNEAFRVTRAQWQKELNEARAKIAELDTLAKDA